MSEILVSTVTAATDTATQDYNANTVIEAIRTGGKKLRGQVEQLREILQRELTTHGDEKRAKQAAGELKKNLPAVMWSGTFSKRANDALVQHSGLLCADLDSLNASLQDVRQKLLSSPYLWALFTSPSGDGLKAVLRVSADAVKHAGSFRAIEHHVKQLTGVQVDQSCKDPARLCFLSYDPKLYHNANAREIESLPEPEKPRYVPNTSVDLSERQRIATELLGAVDWQSETSGFVVCPGKHLHTTVDNQRDCEIKLDKVPTLFCFHNSCRGIVEGVNHELRSRIGKAERKVDQAREAATTITAKAETPKEPVTPRPLGELLDAVENVLRRYVVFPLREETTATALWAVHTWVLDAFDYTPYLHVYSVEKRSGKTRLLDVLQLLTARAWRAVSPSVPVLFRRVEEVKPTLLYDEVDTVFHNGKKDGTEDIRAFLNTGFERGAKITRCVGQGADIKLQDFECFGAKALSGISEDLPDTVSDRCIPIELVRQSREEKVERFRKREAEPGVAAIRAELEALAGQPGIIDALRNARPTLPDDLTDRQQDIAEPLLAIADMAGGEWPGRARQALIKLCVQNEDASTRVKLLAALRGIFDSTASDKLSTKDILEALVNIEDGPWALKFEDALKRDNFQSAASRLARLLKGFKIKPRTINLGGDKSLKGYYRVDFEEPWKRYSPQAVTVVTTATHEGEEVTAPATVTAPGAKAVTPPPLMVKPKVTTVTAVTATPDGEKREAKQESLETDQRQLGNGQAKMPEEGIIALAKTLFNAKEAA